MTLGAATGRMRHRNLVNVPSVNATFGKELRQLFIAPPDKVLVGCDLASAQLRLLAAAMDDEYYSSVVIEGKESNKTDIHSVNARIAGLPNRKIAKTFIYGFLFGAGDQKTARDLDISTREAKDIKAMFLRGLPALGSLKDRLENQFERSGNKHIIAQDGRKILVNSKHKLLNYLLQGNEAILTKNWMVISDRRIKEEGIDCKLLTVMHDEQNFECNPPQAKKLAIILEEAATKAGELLGFKCRMDGSSKIGNNWYEIH
jgi:DNA polymerase I-like protein with 3'-5' exonuclease and polymerase domains